MKNLFMLALALVMTCTFAFAASQSPYEKGKYYGEKIIKFHLEGYEDEDDINILAENMANYINDYLETEEQRYSFLEGIEAGIRKGCNDYGEEIADMYREEFAKMFLPEMQ